MDKTSWMALSIIGALLSTAGLADDAKSSSIDPEPPPMVTLTVETLLAESEYAFHWQLFHPAEAIANSNWPQPIADFHFQDASALAPVSKLRSVSLLTLAESGQVRLYLGVNEEGMVGLHFTAFPRYRDERHLELIRMPFLKEYEPDSEIEQLVPELN